MKNEPNQTSGATSVASKQPAAGGQSVRIMGFVDGDVISPLCYDRPYCLQPGKDDIRAYDVLRDTMQRTRKVGLAAVVIERKHALAAVIPIGRTLVLNVLRSASELVPGQARGAGRATAASARTETSRQPAAAVAGAGVIDLAVRRTGKRAHAIRLPVNAKTTRARVATLHELPRKPAARTSPQARQLA